MGFAKESKLPIQRADRIDGDFEALSILFVADDPAFEGLRRQLSDWKVALCDVDRGMAALQALEVRYSDDSEPLVDAILVDANLSGMSAAQLTQIIRSDARYDAIQVIQVIKVDASTVEVDNLAYKCSIFGELGSNAALEHCHQVIDNIWRRRVESKAEVKTNSDSQGDCVWDHAAMAKRMHGNHELINQILDLFLENTPAQILAMEAAINANKFQDAAAIAHMIKGVASNISAIRLSQVGTEFQQLSLQAEPSKQSFLELMFDFSEQYELLKMRLESYQKSGLL